MSDGRLDTLGRIIARPDRHFPDGIGSLHDRLDDALPDGVLDLIIAALAFVAPAVSIVPEAGYTVWALATVVTFLGISLGFFGAVSFSEGRIRRLQDRVHGHVRGVSVIVGAIIVALGGLWLIPAVGVVDWLYMVLLIGIGHLPLLSGTYAFSKAYLR